MKELVFLTLIAADFVVQKGVLRLSWWRGLWIYLVISILSGFVVWSITFKAPLVWPGFMGTLPFSFILAVVYGLIDFLLRAFLLKILFKISLFQYQFWLMLVLCFAINFGQVFSQFYISR